MKFETKYMSYFSTYLKGVTALTCEVQNSKKWRNSATFNTVTLA